MQNKRFSKAEVERFAQQTLIDHGITSIPIDPVYLAHRLNIKVNNAAFSDETVSGLIAKRDDNIMILVNKNDSPYRKRFTIAHELGHFFMHLSDSDGELVDRDSDLFRDTISLEGSDTSKKIEVEANQFAAALLMPANQVVEAQKTVQAVEELAILFNVSVESMGYRLASLGLLR